MSNLPGRLRRRQPRWLHLRVRSRSRPVLRLILPLEPFETPLAFLLALARWWSTRRLGRSGGWRALFEPLRLGIDGLQPDEPLLEIDSHDSFVSIHIGGLL